MKISLQNAVNKVFLVYTIFQVHFQKNSFTCMICSHEYNKKHFEVMSFETSGHSSFYLEKPSAVHVIQLDVTHALIFACLDSASLFSLNLFLIVYLINCKQQQKKIRTSQIGMLLLAQVLDKLGLKLGHQ